jgi:hypothetical protein
MPSQAGPHADRDQPSLARGWDSFALVKEVNGNLRKSGFPLRRGCLTTAFPSASERNEVGLNHGSSAGCQFRDVRPLLTPPLYLRISRPPIFSERIFAPFSSAARK